MWTTGNMPPLQLSCLLIYKPHEYYSLIGIINHSEIEVMFTNLVIVNGGPHIAGHFFMGSDGVASRSGMIEQICLSIGLLMFVDSAHFCIAPHIYIYITYYIVYL